MKGTGEKKDEASVGPEEAVEDVADLLSNLQVVEDTRNNLDAVESDNNEEEEEEDDDEEGHSGDTESGNEEDVVKSVKLSDAGPEEDPLYVSRGPVFRRNNDTSGISRHAPYVRSKDDVGTSCSGPLLGMFLDEKEAQTSYIFEQLAAAAVASGVARSVREEKGGIPSLPDTRNVHTNPLLMTNVDQLYRSGDLAGGCSRIIARNVNDDFVVLPTPLKVTVDVRLRKIGVWLPKQVLPADVAAKTDSDETVHLYVQLDPRCKRIIEYTASVGREQDNTGHVCTLIKSQFVELAPFTSTSKEFGTGVSGLLSGVDDSEIESALNIVNGKDLADLLKTYGPNNDTMLMALCCKKNESPTLRAQVFALTSRILCQTESKARSNLVLKNAHGLSALDYTTVTNNTRVAAFLAELFYVLGEDISCADASGNTILHMIARKGDVVAPTLQMLMSLHYREGSQKRIYPSEVRNNKNYLPIHIAAMSKRCPQHVVQLLARDMPTCLTSRTSDGSMPIHLACQHSSDPTLIATLLYYNRGVVSEERGDGFTPLHLVAARTDAHDAKLGYILLDEETQVRMIKMLLEHGADRSATVEDRYLPVDLLKVDRTKARALLKLRRNERRSASGGSGNSSSSGSPTETNTAANFVMAQQQQQQQEPLVYTNPPSAGSSSMATPSPAASLFGDPFLNSGDVQQQQQNNMQSTYGYHYSPNAHNGSVSSYGDSVSGNGSDDADSETDNCLAHPLDGNPELDFFAQVLYNHPAIQAVMASTAKEFSGEK